MTGATRAGFVRGAPAAALLALGAAAVLGGAACAGPAGDARAAGTPPAAAQASADSLGRELFDLVDRVADYQAARDRAPRSLREVGLDSLTPRTVRRLELAGDTVAVVVVAWRRAEGRPVLACRGDRQVLEDVALQSGHFAVACTLAGGGTEAFLVSRGGGS